jgi:hypothetical protein
VSDLLDQEIGLMERILQILQRRYEIRQADELDVLQARRELLQLKREKAALQTRAKPDLLEIPPGPAPLLDEQTAGRLINDLIQIARNENEPVAVRKTAIENLALFGTDEIVSELKQLFMDTPEQEIKQAVFVTLSRIQTGPSTLALLDLYDQSTVVPGENLRIAGRIIQELGKRAPTQPTLRDPIIEKLVTIYKEDQRTEFRSLALQHLARFARGTRSSEEE